MSEGFWECNQCGTVVSEGSGSTLLFDGVMCASFRYRSNVRFPPFLGDPERAVWGDGVHGDGTRSPVFCGSCSRPIGVKTHEIDWSNQSHAGLFFITMNAVRFRRSGAVIDDTGSVVDDVRARVDDDLQNQLINMVEEVKRLQHFPKHVCSPSPHPFIEKSGVSMDAWYDMYSRMLETRQVQLVRCGALSFSFQDFHHLLFTYRVSSLITYHHRSGAEVVQLVLDAEYRLVPASPVPADAAVRLVDAAVPLTLLISVVGTLCMTRAIHIMRGRSGAAQCAL